MSLLERWSHRVGDFVDEIMLPEEGHRLWGEANEAMERGDWRRALELLGQFEARWPSTARARAAMGACYLGMGDHARAAQSLGEALEVRPTARAHYLMGRALEVERGPGEALRHYLQGLHLLSEGPQPESLAFDLRFAAGQAWARSGRADKAVRELRRAVRLHAGHLDARMALAEAFLERGMVDEAHEQADQLDPDSPHARVLLVRARVQEALGESRAARLAYERVLTRDPGDQEALLGAARAALACQEFARTREYLDLLRPLAQEGPAQAERETLRGQALMGLESWQEAHGAFLRALQASPHNHPARLGQGEAALHLGRWGEACEAFQAVLGAGAGRLQVRARLGLGRCALQAGELAEARHWLEGALKGAPVRPSPEDEPRAGHWRLQALLLLAELALASQDAAEATVTLGEALDEAHTESEVERVHVALKAAAAELRPRWTTPRSLEDATGLVALLREVRDFVVADGRLAHLQREAQQILAAVDAPLAIAVLGEFNAGKSTFINAILGEDVVPTGVLPTTAHTCVMQYGPRRAARVHYQSGEVEEVNFDEARRLMKQRASDIERIDYLFPHPALRAVHFWDTPGFNALDARHEATAAWALEHCEAMIWMLDANQALSHTELERLGQVAHGKERVVAVLNKVDRLSLDAKARAEAVDELLGYVERHSGERIAGCFALSGLEALDARKREDPDALRRSGFEAFWRFVDEDVLQRAWRIKALESHRALLRLAGTLEQEQARLLARHGELLEKVRAMTDALGALAQQALEALESDLAPAMADQSEYALMAMGREIQELLPPRRALLPGRAMDPDDRQFVLDLLGERLAFVLERAHQAVVHAVLMAEQSLAAHMTPILAGLPLEQARAMTARLEAFFDESRLRQELAGQIFDQLRCAMLDRLQAEGPAVLSRIEQAGEANRHQWTALLSPLLPRPESVLLPQIKAWYASFFLAAERFSTRVERDLRLLELDVRSRLDVSLLQAVVHEIAPAPD